MSGWRGWTGHPRGVLRDVAVNELLVCIAREHVQLRGLEIKRKLALQETRALAPEGL
jgi:hypothetical protein